MNHDDQQDKDLRVAFRQLRDEEAQAAGPFQAQTEARGSWRVRRGTIGAGIVGTALLAGHLAIPHPFFSPEPGSVVDAPAAMGIPFDDFSKLIDDEMRAVSLSEWRTPTKFLLDPKH